MKTRIAAKPVLIASICLANAVVLCAAEPVTEEQLISTLQSTATLQKKDAACAQLKRIGTARSVPVLGALLLDKDLTHSARYALEPMQAPEAEQALIHALRDTSGLAKAGIVHSLGVRGDAAAMGIVSRLLTDSDPDVASAAATSLVRMADTPEGRPLFAALPAAKEPIGREALQDALLAAGYKLIKDGKNKDAAAIFEQFQHAPTPDPVRVAAYRGLIAASAPEQALQLAIAALKGSDVPSQQGALQMARDLKSPEATKELCSLLPQLKDASLQTALIEALRQRNDPEAAPALIAAAGKTDFEARAEALAVLGDLGDSSAVPVLAAAIAASEETERKAARQALLDLRRGNVSDALIKEMGTDKPEVQQAIARILVERRDDGVVAKLLNVARTGSASSRRTAVQALGQLCQSQEVPGLVKLITETNDAEARSQAGAALLKTCVRLQGKGVAVNAEPIAAAFSSNDLGVRVALLPVTAALGDEGLHGRLREALKATEPVVKEAAAKALCDARDFGLWPDLLALAKQADTPNLRTQAIRGCIRLASDSLNTGLSVDKRLEAMQQVLAIAKSPEEKWAVLGSLAETSSPKALDMALPLLDDAATRAEAAQAITKIAAAIKSTNADAARAAVSKVISVATEPAQRQAATAVLDQISTTTANQTPKVQ